MTEFRTVADDALCAMVDALDALDWPLAEESIGDLVSRLGWVRSSDHRGSTGLEVNHDLFTLGVLSGQVSRITVRISDTLDPRDRTAARLVRPAFAAAVEVLTGHLGAPPREQTRTGEAAVWDLTDGRELRIRPGRGMIELEHLAQIRADLDRSLTRLGADPHRDVGEQLADG